MKRSTEVTFTCEPAVAKRLRAASTATDGGVSDSVTRILSQPTIRVTPAVMANSSTLAALRNTSTSLPPNHTANGPTRNPLASPFALASWNNELNTPKNNMQHCHVIHVEAPHQMTPSAQNALLAAITRTPMPAQQQQQQISGQMQQHQRTSATTQTQQQNQVTAAASLQQKQQHQTSVVSTTQQPGLAATSIPQQQQQVPSLAISMPQRQQQQHQAPAVTTSLQQQLPIVAPMQPTPTCATIELSPEDFSQLLGKARSQQHRASIATTSQQQQLPAASSTPREQPQQQLQQQLSTSSPMLREQQQQVAPAQTESAPRVKIEKDVDANSTPAAVPAASPSTDEGKGDSDAGDSTGVSDDVVEIVDDRLCSKEFVEFLNSRDFSDVVLISDSGREFHAHKIVLSAKSPVFKNMLKLFGGEVRLRIEVKDVSDIVMEEVLRFIYSGTVTRIKSCAYELYLAAERYVLRELKERCAQAITVDNVIFTPANAINLLIVSQQSCNAQLKKKAIEFVNQHAAQVISSADFRKLVEFYPHLLAELYFHFAVKTN